jgi:uncharacterized membrane protein
MKSLIKPDDVWFLWAVIVSGVALSIWLEQRFTWAAKISGPVLALCLAMILSNAGVMPATAPVYDVVQDYLVPLALPLLLFRANVFHIVRSTGWLFVAFHLASLGTVVGAIVAARVLNASVDDSPQVAAIMTASYIGGAVNFFAVANSYHATGNIVGPLLVADNFIMAGMFIVLLVICRSNWARRWYPHPHTLDAVDSRELAAEHWRRKEISLSDIAQSLAVAVAVVAAAYGTSRLVEHAMPDHPAAKVASNLFIHITAWATLLATVAPTQLARIHGAEEIGAYLLYVFLFVIGLPANLWQVVVDVPWLFAFCLIVAVANVLFAFVLGWLLRLNLEDIVLAINASLGGPPTAAAMAVSLGWSKLVLPALLVGIWGYTIGTVVGLAVGELLLRWL